MRDLFSLRTAGIHATAAIAAMWLVTAPVTAQSLVNPSFETDAFTLFPGYVSDNGTITGWSGSPANRVGLNPATSNPFADNGAVPNGTNVAFIQSLTNEFTTLSNNITGLTPGYPYEVTFRANRRTVVAAPNPTLSLNGGPFRSFAASPAVGDTNEYYTNRVVFVATGSTAPIVFANQTASDSTVLIDDIRVTMLVVTTAVDGVAGSLRTVISQVPTGSPQATISFFPTLAGATLTLTNQIVVTNNVLIDASALTAGVVIDGGPGTNRLFTFHAGTTNTLIGLNLTGGNGQGGNGGAILNDGQLALIGCAVYSNRANSGAVGLGGGIYGPVSASNCTFSANNAYWGGAINGSVSLTHCTISGNSATGTPSALGGGIYGNGTIENSIVAGNTGTLGGDLYSGGGGFTLNGTNIVQSFSGAPSGNAPINANPLLNALADNGGLTRTRSLQTGSPAIDGAGGSTIGTDQRGLPRGVDGGNGARPDIGAFEAQRAPGSGTENATVTTAADEADAPGNPGTGLSLREAVRGLPSGGTITFDAGVFNGEPADAIMLGSEIILPSRPLTITATNLPDKVAVDGGPGSNRVFYLGTGRTNTLSGLRITGGGGYGAADSGVGGGLYTFGGHWTISDCTIVSNSALTFGAGLRANGGASLDVTRCVFQDNSNALSGGGINLIVSRITMSDCAFSGNSSIDSGGGLTLTSSTGVVARSTFRGNATGLSGGGIIMSTSSSLSLSNCTYSGNSAANGGAMWVQTSSTATLSHVTISGNSAVGHSGGLSIASAGTVVALQHSIIAGNTSSTDSDVRNAGTIIRTGTNIVQTAIGGAGTVTGSGTILAVNPLLDPLTDNGGPTPTMALLPGSPAIDGAGGSSETTDQRGVTRPYGAAPDIGAFEFNSAVVWTNTDSGMGSLRFALQNATNGAAIPFTPSMSGQTITLASELVVTQSVTVSATNLPGGLTLSGNDATRIMLISGGANALLSDLTFAHGWVTGHLNGGGALQVDGGGTATVSRCTFTGNKAVGNDGIFFGDTVLGGAIVNLGHLTLLDSSLHGNSAVGGDGGDGNMPVAGYSGGEARGGAVFNGLDGILQARHSTFQGNTAVGGNGGANTGSGSGGVGGSAIATLENLGIASLIHCTISGNSAAGGIGGTGTSGGLTGRSVGGVSVEFGSVAMTNSILAGNNTNDLFVNASFTGSNNITNGPALLAPLGDYGGPTPTMALLPGSPARNAATGSVATADQRGFPIVGVPDIGAYEAGTFSDYNAWVWETLLPTNADHAAGADPDGDFVSNGNEWGALTDPGNASSYLRALTLGGTNVTFPSVLNRTYRLQQAPSLFGVWSNTVASPIAGDGTIKSFALPAATTQLFFRIEAGP